MNRSLFRLQVLPFISQFALLIVATIVFDFILHQVELVWVGRYLGIPGTVFILFSLVYSLRKRKIIRSGKPSRLLKMHVIFTWLGTLMVLVHAGVHFNAILPWLALGAMIVNVISGMVGQYLLNRSKQQLKLKKEKYKMHGLSKTETEKELFWDAVTFDLMAKWRAVHFPISYAFAVLGIGHILSILLFWGWK